MSVLTKEMTLNKDHKRRDLSKGWCSEGQSFEQAAQELSPSVWEEIKTEFHSSGPMEMNAALFAYTFARLLPTLEDTQNQNGTGRNGAVDIRLTDSSSNTYQIMEVTTSIDSKYQKSSGSLNTFEQQISSSYTGKGSWELELERGWESEKLRELAPDIATALNSVEVNNQLGPHELHPRVIAVPTTAENAPRVKVMGRDAGAQNLSGPYLNILTEYLANDKTIGSKINKLSRERRLFNATRSHLYIGVASTGKNGGLLPLSPSYFTWGEFTAPAEIDELWLEGGTGYLYRWRRESGWIFHRL